MILKAGEQKHVLPERIETHTTQLVVYPDGDPEHNPQSFGHAVVQVSPAETYLLEREPETRDLKGTPTAYSVVHHPEASSLRLHPTPDRDYFAVFRYCPALREI